MEGIDLCVIYGPEYDLWLDGIDPELQAAMVRAYNRWGAEMRASSSGRVLTASPIPLGDVSRAVTEIEYAYHELGIRAFWARPNAYLDPVVRAGISCFTCRTPAAQADADARVDGLAADLASGRWQARYGGELARPSRDYGYRLVVWER